MPKSTSSAIDKALDLLEVVARSDQPLRLSEIAAAVGAHRATAYRILLDLVRRGWVLRAGDHYLPGAALLQLSSSAGRHSLVALCRPVMDALAARTDMMVNLQVLEGDRSRVVEAVQPERLLMISNLRDELLGVERFAGPLALVAMLDDQARQPYLRVAEDAGSSLKGPKGLLAELNRVKEIGYAIELGRNDQLVGSLSRAVLSDKGRPICAVTLVGLNSDFDDARLDELKAELRAATDELEVSLNPISGKKA